MKISIRIEVEASEIDWAGSTVHKSIEDTGICYEVDCIGEYQGHTIEEFGSDADEYLIDRERSRCEEAGLTDIPVSYGRI
jgi:hypothetical protein